MRDWNSGTPNSKPYSGQHSEDPSDNPKISPLWEGDGLPVVDLEVAVGDGVILKAHQLEMENRREGEEDDALLSILTNHTHRYE